LREWCARQKATGIWQLQAMAGTLLRHAKGVLSYYKTGLTSGKMEASTEKSVACSPALFGFR
jgi:transposase